MSFAPLASTPPQKPAAPAPVSPLRGPLLPLMILGCFAVLIAIIAFMLPELGRDGAITDYDAFHVVGILLHEGRAHVAYHIPAMTAEMVRLINTDEILPWTYPPMFNLVAGALATMSRPIGFGVFVGGGLLLWALLLWRLAGDRLTWVLVLIFPALFTQVLTGQTGFLIGALAAGFALLWLKGEREGQTAPRQIGAGVLLGLMCLKPHLGLGIGVMALLRGQWLLAGTALSVVAALAGLATLVMGPAIWPAFFAGIGEAGEMLRQGQYQFLRMTSLYSALASLGLPAAAAMAAQLALALLMLGALAWLTLRKSTPPNRLLALAAVIGFGLSPYSYDYDLMLVAVALALVSREIFERASRGELFGMILLGWLAGKSGFGFLGRAFFSTEHPLIELLRGPLPGGLAPGGFALLALLLWVVLILRRPGPAAP